MTRSTSSPNGWQSQDSNTGLADDLLPLPIGLTQDLYHFLLERMRIGQAGGEEGWRPGLCLDTQVSPSAHEGTFSLLTEITIIDVIH